MSAREDILRRFQPKALTKEQVAEIEGIQSGFVDTADWILNATNPSREQRAALTALEEAAGWAVRAIEMHGPAPVTDEMRANLEAMLDDSYPSAPLGDGQGPATPTRMIDIVDSLVGTRGLTDSDQDAADAKVAHVTDLHPTKSAVDEHRTRSNRRVSTGQQIVDGARPLAAVTGGAGQEPTPRPFATGGFTGGPGNYEAAGIVHQGGYYLPRGAAKALGLVPFDALSVDRGGVTLTVSAAEIARAAAATDSLPETNRGAA